MKSYLIKILAVLMLLGLPAQAYTLKQLRSLNAVTTATNGLSFDGSTAAQMPPPGGGVQWTVLLWDNGANITATITIQVKMIDGTWVTAQPFAPNNSNVTTSQANFSVSAARLGTGQQMFSFEGPLVDIRVITTAQTVGSITADILVIY